MPEDGVSVDGPWGPVDSEIAGAGVAERHIVAETGDEMLTVRYGHGSGEMMSPDAFGRCGPEMCESGGRSARLATMV